MKKSVFVGIAVVILCGAGIVLANFSSGAKNGMATGAGMSGGKGGKGGGNTVVSVKSQILKKETLHGYISTNGEIESQNSVSVFPDISGKVVETTVMLGSSVTKGEILGYVDPSTPGSYFKKSPIYAPISGSIISVPLKNGTTVSTNTSICVIGDIRNLQITANVSERYIAVLKKGLKAKISVEAYPNVTFDATVVRVSPVVDAASRSKQVVLNFDSRDERINAGMFAKVILFTEDYSGFVTMPKDSLVQNGDNYFAYVINNDSTVSKRKVELGNVVDGIIQITKGLEENEKVVVQGQTSLADGSKIQEISDSSSKSSNLDKKVEKGELKEKAENADNTRKPRKEKRGE